MKKEQVIKAAAIAAVILISGVFYTVKQQSETRGSKGSRLCIRKNLLHRKKQKTHKM